MTIESEIKRAADNLEAVENALLQLLRLAAPPRIVEPASFDPELYGATQWRTPMQFVPTPRSTDASVAYLNGQWKRRDGHGVQTDLPTGGGRSAEPVQQLDPWARRSPPAKDV